ncbi:MAG: hypothetical protein ABI446_07205 [Gemmatimonadaceae bacterium]
MTPLRRYFSRGPATPSGRSSHVRSTGLFAVLALALLATIALTAQAWLASRDQRRAAEAAVRDYARFAANDYSMDTERALRQTAMAVFSWLGAKSSRLEADSLYDLSLMQTAAADVKTCECMWDLRPLYFFRYIPSTNELKTLGPHTPSAMEEAVLRDSVKGDPKEPLFGMPNVLRDAFYMMSFQDSLAGGLVRTFAPLARQQGISIREELDDSLAASISRRAVAGATLVNIMNMQNDPRRAEYFRKTQNGTYGGVDINGNAGPNGISGLRGTRNDAGFRQPIVTSDANSLILAEANFVLHRAGAAQPYLDTERSSNELTLLVATLQSIMTEKYIALFQNIEVWSDSKRTCLSALLHSTIRHSAM